MEIFSMVVLGGEYVMTYCWHPGGAYSLLPYLFINRYSI